jgi:hypothetical protein
VPHHLGRLANVSKAEAEVGDARVVQQRLQLAQHVVRRADWCAYVGVMPHLAGRLQLRERRDVLVRDPVALFVEGAVVVQTLLNFVPRSIPRVGNVA